MALFSVGDGLVGITNVYYVIYTDNYTEHLLLYKTINNRII